MTTKRENAAGYGKIVGIGTLATVVGAIGSEFMSGEWVDIITRIGLPLVLLAVAVRYGAQVVAEKDAEIKRLNEARVRDAVNHAERLFKVTTGANEMVREANQTLDFVADRKKAK